MGSFRSYTYTDKDIIFLKSASFEYHIKGRLKKKKKNSRGYIQKQITRDNNLPGPEGKQRMNTLRAYIGPKHPDTVHTCLILIFFFFWHHKVQCVF